ncbi:MAG: hypothetical protein OXU51_08225 [Candidatus Poribacteria bacterium]|nr:hypothetical protein [Candidatus Poribacteria bacterium]
MKTQRFSNWNTSVSTIGFLLLVATTQIGCGVFVNRVMRRDAIILTQSDLYRIGLTKRNRIRRYPDYPFTIRDILKGSSVIAGFQQGGSGDLTIQYWLFDSSSTAKKAAEAEWTWRFSGVPNFQPELNSEDIIGEATWRNIHKSREAEESEKGPTDIYFVKHNLLVSIRTVGHPSKDLQDARDIARHIEAKIEAVLEKK